MAVLVLSPASSTTAATHQPSEHPPSQHLPSPPAAIFQPHALPQPPMQPAPTASKSMRANPFRSASEALENTFV